MKFRICRTFLVKSEQDIELDPKQFKHCASIEELNNEVEDYIESLCEFPKVNGFQSAEEIGLQYYDCYWMNEGENSFYLEWQKLKNLPEEL